MDRPIERFWNLLSVRGILNKKDLLREMVRIHKTRVSLLHHEGLDKSPGQLFQYMKQFIDGGTLGYFPGDQDLFYKLYEIGKDVNLVDFMTETFKGDRGELFAPPYLVSYIKEEIKNKKPRQVLFPEAEKLINGLKDLVLSFQETGFTLTTQDVLYKEFFQLAFYDHEHIEIKQLSIYSKIDLEPEYDFVFSIPAFGGKGADEYSYSYRSREYEGIATENLLPLLGKEGIFYEIVPAKFAFGSSLKKVRSWINQEYAVQCLYILPEGTFRPFTGIKTYLLGVTKQTINDITIGTLTLTNQQFYLEGSKKIKSNEFENHEDWRIELFLVDDEDELKAFRESSVPKVKLNQVAEIFRGKSIMKGDLKPGEFAVLNISNIEEGEVIFENMDTIDEDERKIKRYELMEDDLVITCRGTVIKVAVFKNAPRKVIASANIIVVRFKERINSNYVKIFLESPVGTTLIHSFQRGTTIMNLNPKDIGELEIPLLDYYLQDEIVNKYQKKYQVYKEAVRYATERWVEEKQSIYQRLLQ